MICVSSNFDGGNVDCQRCELADDIQLNIRKDNQSDFYQWFYFRLTGAKGQACTIKLLNAGNAAYVDGFKNYSAVVSYDRESWFRIPTQFDGTSLTMHLTPELDSVYLAYFAPFSMERHADLISWACLDPRVSYERLGATLDGQDMDLLKISDGSPGKKKFWTIARQHPGETMAEWWMEGFLARVLDNDDPVSRELLKRADIYVVPNMNPDGSKRGHLRTNAAGMNLNREWLSPTEEKSPEVFYVLNKMREVGVDFCLDVHGDEALPYNFIAGAEGTPSWNDQKQQDLDFYKAQLMLTNPDFQIEKGYPVSAPGKADLRICTNFIAEEFDCLSMTLEMPFKDTVETPDDRYGWSPERCQKLAESNVEVMYQFALR